MDETVLTVIGLAVVAFGLVSARAQKSVVTPPIAFLLLGFVIGGKGLGWVDPGLDDEAIRTLAELTLVVVLFTDASRIDLKLLRREHHLPVRLLSVGLPLSIGLGTLAASWLFTEWNVWAAAALAAIVAPTDAALAHPVVTNRLVPARVRQAISVESGLNDGICLPVFVLFLCGARAAGHVDDVAYWVWFGLLQITLGPLVGVAVGYFGGRMVQRAWDRKWVSRSFLDLSALALAAVAFGAADLLGGNGFIAAFCAGLTVGNCARSVCGALYEFGETEGQLLSLVVFLVVGAVIAPVIVDGMNVTSLIFALLSLTVLRMLPVALSLIGAGLKRETPWFIGWFGPRGTASIVFAMILLQESLIPLRQEIFAVAMTTVMLSVLAHGLTAIPAARWYARRLNVVQQAPLAVEHQPLTEMPFCCTADLDVNYSPSHRSHS